MTMSLSLIHNGSIKEAGEFGLKQLSYLFIFNSALCWVLLAAMLLLLKLGVFMTKIRRKFVVISEIFFPEFIITFFKKYISGKIFPSQLILRMRKMRECTKKCHIIRPIRCFCYILSECQKVRNSHILWEQNGRF